MIRRLSLILGLSTSVMLAQQDDPFAIPEILPPSPTAFELTKYGDIPLDESTGIANIGIDLFQYKIGNFSVPISMSYATTGVKVNQVSSWVGMGWNLTAGGTITREVRDLPDELANSRPMPSFSSVYQMYLNGDVPYYEFMLDVEDDNDTDYEPDLYSFNVSGYKGTFILNQNLEPVLLDFNKSVTLERTTYGDFLLKTPEGHSYLFATRETSENENSCSVGSVTTPQVTTWYLSEINTKDGDKINFNYSSHTLYYASGFNQNHYRPINYFADPNDNCTDPSTVYNNCRLYSYVNAKKLSSITNTKNDDVLQFTTGSKTDVDNGGLKLEKIALFDGSKHIRSYEFRYQTIQSIYTSNNSHLPGSTFRYRLFLDKIVEISKSGLEEGRVHSFEYNSSHLLPPRFDYAQDILGFNNGNRFNTSLFPAYSSGGEPPVSYDASNRDPDFSKSLYGIITKVNFPTGGFSEFVYEPNSVVKTESSYTQSNINFTVNSFGNIIDSRNFTAYANESIDVSVNVNVLSGNDYTHDNVIVKIRDITDNVIIVNETVTYQGKTFYGVQLDAGHQYEVSLDLSPVKFDDVEATMTFSYISGESSQEVVNNSGIRIQKIISKPNQLASPLVKRYYYNRKENYDLNGPIITAGSYDHWRIIEKRLDCGTESYDEFQISSEDWAMDLGYYKRSINFYQYVTVSHGGDLFEAGGTEKGFSFYSDSTPYAFGKEVIPNISLSDESQFNGDILYEEHFKYTFPNFDVVNRTDYYYEFLDNESFDAFVGFNQSPAYQAAYFPSISIGEIAAQTKDYVLNHYIYKSEIRNLKGKTTRSFYNNEVVIDSTYNIYNSPNHNYPTITKNYYTNKVKIQEFIYPDDVTTNSSLYSTNLLEPELAAINKLKKAEMHDIDEPVEIVTKIILNDGLNSAESVVLNTYKLSNNKAERGVISSKKIGENNPDPRIQYYLYDESGNPLELSRVDGAHIVYLWGYSDQHPIAKIENATSTEVNAFLGDLSLVNETNLPAINNLRSNLPNAMITTYEYEPLVGLRSITDPKGNTTSYEYDDFQRLKFVKDHDGKLLKENHYNYKN